MHSLSVKGLIEVNDLADDYRSLGATWGIALRYQFENGWGASVIRHYGSYGGPEGHWELGVLNADGNLDYTTPITKDVEGWLSPERVNELLSAIEQLPAKEASDVEVA